MATLSITRLYEADQVLFEVDLDEIRADIETFVNTIKLNDDNIQDSGIDAETKVLDGSVSAALIATSAVTTTKILDASVGTEALADGAITTAKIDTGSKLSGAPFAANAVEYEKLTAAAARFALGSATDTIVDTTWDSIGQVSISCTGNRPVIIMLLPNNPSAGSSSITLSRTISSGVSPVRGYFRLARGLTDIGFSEFSFVAYRPASAATTFKYSIPAATICKIDPTPGSGTINYVFYGKTGSSNETMTIDCRILAFELP